MSPSNPEQDKPMHYKITLQSDEWTIKGLPTDDNSWTFCYDRPDVSKQTADFAKYNCVLWTVGYNHTCDTPASLATGIYQALYDELQTNNHIKDGDTFIVMGQHYKDFYLPTLQFKVESVHVLPDSDTTKTLIKQQLELDRKNRSESYDGF